jgi:hypothetical protein
MSETYELETKLIRNALKLIYGNLGSKNVLVEKPKVPNLECTPSQKFWLRLCMLKAKFD